MYEKQSKEWKIFYGPLLDTQPANIRKTKDFWCFQGE